MYLLRVYHSTCVWRVEDNFVEFIPSFYLYVALGAELGLPGLCGKALLLLSHLVGPDFPAFKVKILSLYACAAIPFSVRL